MAEQQGTGLKAALPLREDGFTSASLFLSPLKGHIPTYTHPWL